MCMHCWWLEKAKETAVLAADVADVSFILTPRNTPETKAAYATGAILLVVMQGFLEELEAVAAAGRPVRSGMEALVGPVMAWARANLKRFPIQNYDRDGNPSQFAGGPAAGNPDVYPGAWQPVGMCDTAAALHPKLTRGNKLRQTMEHGWNEHEDGKSRSAAPTHDADDLPTSVDTAVEHDRRAAERMREDERDIQKAFRAMVMGTGEQPRRGPVRFRKKLKGTRRG